MTREMFIKNLVQLGVPYSTIDAILRYSNNRPNPRAYQDLQKLLGATPRHCAA